MRNIMQTKRTERVRELGRAHPHARVQDDDDDDDIDTDVCA